MRSILAGGASNDLSLDIAQRAESTCECLVDAPKGALCNLSRKAWPLLGLDFSCLNEALCGCFPAQLPAGKVRAS